MIRSAWINGAALAGAFVCAAAATPASALTAIQQCGQQYQAAKAAGTLNGMNWNQFRSDCTARLKAEPASTVILPAPDAAAVPTVSRPLPANPLKPPPAIPAPGVAVTPPVVVPPGAATVPAGTLANPALPKTGAASPGRTAMLTRERQCGAEWRAQKPALVAATPGLTWPKYWSQCNTRLKASGQ